MAGCLVLLFLARCVFSGKLPCLLYKGLVMILKFRALGSDENLESIQFQVLSHHQGLAQPGGVEVITKQSSNFE